MFSRPAPPRPGKIRLVGHSLGHQLALRAAAIIAEDQTAPQPDRIALLDPFWSKGPKAYLPRGRDKIRFATAPAGKRLGRGDRCGIGAVPQLVLSARGFLSAIVILI